MFRNTLDKLVNNRDIHGVCGIISRTGSGVKLLSRSAALHPEIGVCSDSKSARLIVEKGKQYSSCSYNLSGIQLWCDGSHNAEGITTLRHIHSEVKKDGECLICGAKTTKNRPLCDGDHKVKKQQYTDPPQYCAYAESPVYEGVANKLGYKPKQKRWHF